MYPMETRLQGILDRFVERHAGASQRSAEWYASMATTIGGSEIKALLGGPRAQKSGRAVEALVRAKVAALRGGGAWASNIPCIWGTIFEDVAADVIATHFGTRVVGEDLCIRVHPGHRTSPDGYCVLRVAPQGGGGALEALPSSDPRFGAATEARVAMIEIKCPYSRLPDPAAAGLAAVPAQYQSQVWSGLAVSPVASFGLFVDCVFRLCTLEQAAAAAGEGPEALRDAYCAEYHRRDPGAEELRAQGYGAQAAGVVVVYAPRAGAPQRVRYGWRGDACTEAELASLLDGHEYAQQLRAGEDWLVDLGARAQEVDQVLRCIDRRIFRIRRPAASFADGRGAAWDPDGAAAAPAPGEADAEHFEPLALLPWKLMHVTYATVARVPRFLEPLLPAIAEVHRLAADAVASGDPEAWLAARYPARPPSPDEATLAYFAALAASAS